MQTQVDKFEFGDVLRKANNVDGTKNTVKSLFAFRVFVVCLTAVYSGPEAFLRVM